MNNKFSKSFKLNNLKDSTILKYGIFNFKYAVIQDEKLNLKIERQKKATQ